MSESLEERTEQATPRWIRQRRLHGDVARSAELVTAIVLLSASVGLALYGAVLTDRLVAGLSEALGQCDAVPLRSEELAERLRSALGEALGALLPLLASLCFMSIAASVMQTGPLFVPGLLKPQLARLSPAGRFGQILSGANVVRFGITTVKVAAIVALTAVTLMEYWPELRWLGERSVPQIAVFAASGTFSVAVKVSLLLCLFGLIELANERWRWFQSLRMSTAQRRDEQRETEGQPILRRRRHAIPRSATRQRVG